MSERDAKVLAQIGVYDGAEAREFALILDDLKDGYEDFEHSRLDLFRVHLIGSRFVFSV